MVVLEGTISLAELSTNKNTSQKEKDNCNERENN